MTKSQWEAVITHPDKLLVDFVFGFVSLSSAEKELIRLRFQEGLTQEEAAEAMSTDRRTYCTRTVQKLEKTAFRKCASVWSGMSVVNHYMLKEHSL